MSQSLFRKESLQRLSSPEQMDDYLRGPGIGGWPLLIAILLVVVGAIVWAIWGRLEVSRSTAGICENGSITCLVSSEIAEQLTDQSRLIVEGREYTFSLDSQPMPVPETTNSYLLSVSQLQPGDWAYELRANVPVEDGIYDVNLLVDRFQPLALLWN